MSCLLIPGRLLGTDWLVVAPASIIIAFATCVALTPARLLSA